MTKVLVIRLMAKYAQYGHFTKIWPYWPYLVISLMVKIMVKMGIPGKKIKKKVTTEEIK